MSGMRVQNIDIVQHTNYVFQSFFLSLVFDTLFLLDGDSIDIDRKHRQRGGINARQVHCCNQISGIVGIRYGS